MRNITINSTTQRIIIDPTSSEVTVLSAGPQGPVGVAGPEGPQGPIGLSGVHVGTIPPTDTSILWYDTN